MLLKLFLVLFSAVFVKSIIVPEQNVSKRTLHTVGIKTLGWQGTSNEHGDIIMHHNYSKVQNDNNPNRTSLSIESITKKNFEQTSQHFQGTDQNVEQTNQDFDQINYNFDQSRQDSDQIKQKFDQISQKFDQIDQNFHQTKHFDQNFDQIRQDSDQIEQNFDQISQNFDQISQNFDQTKHFDQISQNSNENYDQTERHTHIENKQNLNFFDQNSDQLSPHPNVFVDGRKLHGNFEKYTNSQSIYKKCPKGATGQFAYELSCNQFLNCWKGRGFVQNCATGTLFNPVTSECDYPEKVNCITGPRALELKDALSSEAQASCPHGFTGLIPHYTNCEKFISCHDGVEVAMDCPPGTLFDLKTNVCDFPYKSECANRTEQIEDSRFHHGYTNRFVVVRPYQGNNTYQYHKMTSQHHLGQIGPNLYGQLGQYAQNQFLQNRTQINDQLSEFSQINSTNGNQFGTNQGTYEYQNVRPLGQFGPNLYGQLGQFAQNQFLQNRTQINDQLGQFSQINATNGNQFGTNQGTYEYQRVRPLGQFGPNLYGQLGHFAQNQFLQTNRTQKVDDQLDEFSQINATSGRQFGTSQNVGIDDQLGGFSGRKPVQVNDHLGQFSRQNRHNSTGRNQFGGQNQFGGKNQFDEQNQFGGQNQFDGQNQFGGQNQLDGQNQFLVRGQNGGIVQQNRNTSGQNQFHRQNQFLVGGQNAIRQNQFDHQNQFEPQNQFDHQNKFEHQNQFDRQNQFLASGQNGNINQQRENTTWQHQSGGQSLVGGHNSQNQHNQHLNKNSTSHLHQQRPPFGRGYYVQNQQSRQNQFDNQDQFGTRYHGNLNQTQQTQDHRTQPIQNPWVAQSQQTLRPKCSSNQIGLYPHPSDCSKFLNCGPNGQTFVQDCGPGTVFNPAIKACDYPYRTNCGSATQSQGKYPQGTEFGRSKPTQRGQLVAEGFYDHLDQTQQTSNWTKISNQNLQQESRVTQNLNWEDQNRRDFAEVQNAWTYVSEGQNQNTQDLYKGQGQRGNWQGNRNDESQNVRPVYVHQGQINTTLSEGQNTWPIFIQNGHNLNRQDEHHGKVQNHSTVQNTWTVQKFEDHKPSKHAPPPFPTTDPNADYVFEDEDFVEVEDLDRGTKDRCEADDFRCEKDVCVTQAKVCDGFADCENAKDESHCEKYVEQFTLIPKAKLAVKEDKKFYNMSLNICAKTCTESKGQQCKAFNYRKNDATCFILGTNVGLSGGLFLLPNYDYYEYKKFTLNCANMFECNNKKCINYNQVCDGVSDCGDRMDEKGCKAEKLGYEAKLVGSPNPYEGIVLISAFGKSGYICDDMFGLRNGHVLCKELGFELGALEVRGNSYFNSNPSSNETFYMMDDVTCLGNETSLRDCDFNGWGVHNCLEREIVGVVCKTPQKSCPEDTWKCETGNDCIPFNFVCDGVHDCDDKSDEGSQYCEAAVELKLSDGKSEKDGRIEIRYHGTWGTVCDDDFNEDAAKVVCKYLGYSGSSQVKKDGYYGPGKGQIWLDQVFCQGNESALEDCYHWDWGVHNCDHSEDVGVICGDQYENSPRSMKPEVPPTLPISTFSNRCGYRNDDVFLENDDVHFRVVKGLLAQKGHYPWQASLRLNVKNKSSHWCGAVVVAQRFVLTAAHCLSGYTKGGFVVVAGDYEVDVDEGTEQRTYIEEFYVHPEFRNGSRMNNDIAVIKLKGIGFNLTKDVQPICLPDLDFMTEQGMNCTISGFGSVKSGKAVASKELRAGWIPIQSPEVCKMPHVYGKSITDGMLCAGSLDEGIDACDGDSGGPLACLHNGLFTLIGVTSWGQHCGYANKPGVYVKVAHYRDWIDRTINNHT